MKNNVIQGLSALLFLIFSISAGFGQIPASAKAGTFKDWGYSATGVFGIIPLVNIQNRPYYKIFKTSEASVKIQEYNAAGVLTYTHLVRFLNGKLNQMAITDRWGDTYDITRFATSGPDEFTVTEKNTGKNSYLPCKGAKYIYHENLLSEIQYLSYAGKLAVNSSGVSIIKYKRYNDDKRFSLVKEMAFFDADGQPVISSSYDCHKVVYEYDERGNEISVAYYGKDDEPLTDRYGGFKNRFTYNENDQMSSVEIIGINDDITANAYGVAKVKYEYKNGLMSEATRLDRQNNITKGSDASEGVAIFTYEYDGHGNKLNDSYFDEKNNPVNSRYGYQKITYSYDPLDMYTGTAYFDMSGSPANNKSGIHKYSFVRDDKGRIIQRSYYDKNNAPLKDNLDVVNMIKYSYDEWGRTSAISYWENSTTKMNRWNGNHQTMYKYNDEGQVIEQVFLDQSGNQFVTKSGYSRSLTFYNAEGKESEYKFFKNDVPVTVDSSFANKFHAVKFYYDGSGRLASLMYFDSNEQPVDAHISLTQPVDCQKIEFIYKGNTITEERLYTRNSEAPAKIIDCLKDDYVNSSGLSMGYKNVY